MLHALPQKSITATFTARHWIYTAAAPPQPPFANLPTYPLVLRRLSGLALPDDHGLEVLPLRALRLDFLDQWREVQGVLQRPVSSPTHNLTWVSNLYRQSLHSRIS